MKEFAEISEKCSARQPTQDFHILDVFLLKESRLCVSRTSLREKVIRDLHEGGLAGRFRRDKSTNSFE